MKIISNQYSLNVYNWDTNEEYKEDSTKPG
jgi:hypothetical protein